LSDEPRILNVRLPIGKIVNQCYISSGYARAQYFVLELLSVNDGH